LFLDLLSFLRVQAERFGLLWHGSSRLLSLLALCFPSPSSFLTSTLWKKPRNGSIPEDEGPRRGAGAADPGAPARCPRAARHRPGADACQGPRGAVRQPRRRRLGRATLRGRCRVGGPGRGPRRGRRLNEMLPTSYSVL